MRLIKRLNVKLRFVFSTTFCLLVSSFAMADSVTYTYDSLNRLESAAYSDGIIEYTYDSAGNITQVVIQGCSDIFYRDADSDGFGDPDDSITACTQPTGYVVDNTDCLDSNAEANPGAAEICGNGVDNNCDGLTDCDKDDDGLLDDWEQQIADDDPADVIEDIHDVLPGGDYDGDGYTNLEEYQAGSDPTDPESVPIVVADWFVDGEAASSGTGTSWSAAFKTIQEALSSSSSGDMVWVKEGTYFLSQQLVVNSEVNLYGGFPASQPSPAWEDRDSKIYLTVLDGQGVSRCLSVGSDALIDGFAITGGDETNGGGLYTNASPSIVECRIESNNAYYGGGIYSDGGFPIISRCMLLANTSMDDGGGIYVDSGSIEIINSLFVGNQTVVSGAGLYNALGDTNIFNSTFTENTADFRGGAIYSQGGTLDVVNSILWGDSALQSSEIFNSGAAVTVTYSDIEGGYYGVGNINSAPVFAKSPGAGDDLIWGTSDDDFGHLNLTKDSPCIDAGSSLGDSLFDILKTLRPLDGDEIGAGSTGDGSDVDIGAYEYSPDDFDSDGIGNAIDNCPTSYNPQQLDYDNDTIGNACDESPGCESCPEGYECRDNACVPSCSVDADCNDDGQYCTGTPICSDGVCSLSGDPCGGDAPLCNETLDLCVECFENTDCNDGLYCTGQEECFGGFCVEGVPPCLSEEYCDEIGKQCVECLDDIHCDDTLFCNGIETCAGGLCYLGSPPCDMDEYCDERADQCVECLNDSHCSLGEICTNTMCVSLPTTSPVIDVTLKGLGTLDVFFTADQQDIVLIDLTGTTTDTTLTIKSSIKDAYVYLDELNIDGSLKALNCKGIVLSGPLTATGGIGQIKVDAAVQGSSIEASWIGKLTVKGDFEGDMWLSGEGYLPKDLTLGMVSIKGRFSDSIWFINGNVGSIKVGTWGTGSTLAVGVDPGGDGLFFTGDDYATGGWLGKFKCKYYDTNNGGDAFGIIADDYLKLKKITLPFEDGDFCIWEK